MQEALGVRDKVERMGQRMIRDHLPEQHAEFYSSLPFVFAGSVDASGRPWASLLMGQPGFMHSPNPGVLSIDAWPMAGDALHDNLYPNARIGLLGIDFATRRRNRLAAGIASTSGQSIQLAIHQTFGNCPMYIQAREYERPAFDTPHKAGAPVSLSRLSEDAQNIIANADNFYIASHHADGGAARHGADVSHRGGKPGFVRIDDDQSLTFPDFRGNRHFNTLGNILLNNKAGLLFIDFASGDLLQLTGKASIDTTSPHIKAFAGAERLVHFQLKSGTLLPRAIDGSWQFIDYASQLNSTGSWAATTQEI